jgi:uncharacterized membrane protein YccC
METGRHELVVRQKLQVGKAIVDALAMGIACLVSYFLITRILGRTYFLSRDDELLGGMWAVIATIFVYRQSYLESVKAALSRVSATSVSFALCLIYLLAFPFHPAGMATLIGIGTVVMVLLGRSEDVITTGITTAVVMIVAAISPERSWKVPILRLIDTVVGTVVGIAAARIAVTFSGPSQKETVSDNLKAST